MKLTVSMVRQGTQGNEREIGGKIGKKSVIGAWRRRGNCLQSIVKLPSIMKRYRQPASFDSIWKTPNANNPLNAFAIFEAA